MKEVHYEELSCLHQNNLQLDKVEGLTRTSGVCPKGCKNVQVSLTQTIEIP